MKTGHLSAWEQEEYLLGQRTSRMLHHLTECAGCRASVERLEQGVTIFRRAAVEWSAECLATRPQRVQTFSARRLPALRWAIAAVIPLLLLLVALVPFQLSRPPASSPVAQISDDALLEQVDEQVSVAVPSSMESLTHLVSAGNSSAPVAAAEGSSHIVQKN